MTDETKTDKLLSSVSGNNHTDERIARIEARIDKRSAAICADFIANARDRREYAEMMGTDDYYKWMDARWGMKPKKAISQIRVADLADDHAIDDFYGEPESLEVLARYGSKHPVTAMVMSKMRDRDFMSEDRIKALKKVWDQERGSKKKKVVVEDETPVDKSFQIGIDAIFSKAVAISGKLGSVDDLPDSVRRRVRAGMPVMKKIMEIMSDEVDA